jgi:protocatechuate 3,4-dioxygenase beta subunit
MDNDDGQVGQILNRRDVLKILGLGSAASILTACAPQVAETISSTSVPTTAPMTTAVTEVVATELASVATAIPICVVRPEMTEGPYFVDEMLNRSDVRSDPSDGSISQGAQFDLTFNVTQVGTNGCVSLPGAQVDIWHCDAFGVYSDARDPSFDTTGKKFLRGYQVTDASGLARFITIYPGWYNGRAVHIHFKIRAGSQEFTSQLFFDEAFTDQVYLQEPYAQKGERTVRNEQDNIYNSGGSQLTLIVTPSETGYAATFDIGMQI